MVNQKSTDASSRLISSKCTTSSDILLRVHGVHMKLDRELLAAKSAKLAVLLRENSDEEICCFLEDIIADPDAFELVARFCYGYEMQICTGNVVALICLSYYLQMTETHSANNLLSKALDFLEHRVLPSWNETIKAFCIRENVLQQAVHLGLVNACVESITAKTVLDPRLIGEPIKGSNDVDSSEDEDDKYRPNARRKLFVPNWRSESLEILPLPVYESVIEAINNTQVPSAYVAGSLCQYVEKWVLLSRTENDIITVCKDSRREIIEAVERLLPAERGLLPCTVLFEMLRFAIDLEASSDCKSGLEKRIGEQLDHATVKDLLIPTQGYAKEVQYDIECVRRILKHYYGNYANPGTTGLMKVAELVEQFLAEVANDIDLKMETFILLAETSIAASSGMPKDSDGIYKAINIFLDTHRYLTESEREQICEVLDCHKLSHAAREHAARNERLPMRVVVQILFAGQLQLQDAITKEVHSTYDKLIKEDEDKEDKSNKSGESEGVKMEIAKMSNKVIELENQCNMIRKEIEKGCSHTMKKEKISIWGEMKRKFGCVSGKHDFSHQVKKKKMHSYKRVHNI